MLCAVAAAVVASGWLVSAMDASPARAIALPVHVHPVLTVAPPATPPDVPLPVAPCPVPGFSHFHASRHLLIATDTPVDGARIAQVDEETCAHMMALAGLAPPAAPVPVFLCGTEQQVRAVETHHGTQRSSPWHGGAFYWRVPMIIVQVDTDLEHTVSHEMVHWIVRGAVPTCPAVIDEGLAVIVGERIKAERVARGVAGSDSDRTSRSSVWRRAERLRRQWLREPPPPLEEFMQLNHATARELFGSYGYRYHDLSACLVGVLLSRQEPDTRGIGAFLAHCRGADPAQDHYEKLRTFYPAEEVESRWAEEVGFPSEHE